MSSLLTNQLEDAANWSPVAVAKLTSPLSAGASLGHEQKPGPELGVPHADAPRRVEDHVTRRRLTGGVLEKNAKITRCQYHFGGTP